MMVSDVMRFNDLLMAVASGKITQMGAVSGSEARPGKTLPGAAKRALAEAAARREQYRKREAAMPKEIGGRGGLEPGRYGDWEIKGLSSDF
jgi:hypothetical protein